MSTPFPSPIPELIAEGRDTVIHRALRGDQPVLVRRPRHVPPSADVLARLRYGAAVARTVDVPGVARVLGVEESEGSVAVLIEDFGGGTLESVLAHAHDGSGGGGRLEITEAVRIATQIARTLGALHERRIVHKSIEPSSILVNLATGGVRLTNFDVASRLDREAPALIGPSRAGDALAYVAPEQTGRMNRAVDYRADLYSLGVTLYEMLTGRVPFADGDPAVVVQGHLAVAPIPPRELRPSVPGALSSVVLKLLAKNAEDRYQSAEGLVFDLNECLGHLVDGATLADFQVGKNDVLMTFQLPQQLYGRAAEREALVAALTRASRGAAELFLVSGPSGVGKTALVHELRSAIGREHGYFCAGSGDPVRAAPYGVLAQALGELCAEIIAEGEARVASFRARILAAVGPSTELLFAAIPALGRLVGPLAPAPRLGPAEARDRFDVAFQRLLAAFAGREHPLAIFLDDLHWADPASLRMIEIVLRDPGGRHLLVIGAVEDAEAPAIARAVAAVRAGVTPVHTLALEPLREPEVIRFAADALACPSDDPPLALASFILRTTGGNPLVAHQLLGWLHAGGLLDLDAASGRWHARLGGLGGGAILADAKALFDARISALPARALRVLAIAACFGARFDLGTLSRAAGDACRDAAADLWAAVEAGLIHPIGGAHRSAIVVGADPPGDVEYAFVHPRAHEAALGRVSLEQRTELRARAARQLLAETPPEQRAAKSFDLSDQLSAAVDPDDWIALASIDLDAGERARRCNAHAAASRYLDTGLARLPGEAAWESAYALTFALHRDHAECAYLEGRAAEAEAEIDLLRLRACSAADAIAVDIFHVALAVGCGNFADALRVGSAALRRQGIVLAEREGLGAALAAEVEAVSAALAGRSIASLLDAPVTSDPDERARVELLSLALRAAASNDLDRYRLAGAMIVHRSLRHGHVPLSAIGYAAYAVLADPRSDLGAELGSLAIQLAERYAGPGVRATVQLLTALFAGPRRRPLEESLEVLEQTHAKALAAGDLRVAGGAAAQRLLLGLMSGEDLYRLQDRAGAVVPLLQRLGRPIAGALAASIQCTLNALTRGPEGADPPGGVVQPPETVTDERTTLACFWVTELQRAFLTGDHVRTLSLAARAGATLETVQGHPIEAEYCYYHALVLAADPSASGRRQVIEAHRERLQAWADGSPGSFRHRHLLVAAEAARLADNDRAAVDLYDRAIESAAEHRHPGGEALAAELAARFYLVAGRRRVAGAYLLDACRAYARWGADAKVAELARRYPDLLPETAAARTGAQQGAPAAFDAMGVLRAGQAICGEVDLESLLRELLTSVLGAAGAERAVLLLDGEGQDRAVVEAHRVAGAVQVRPRAASLDDPLPLALSIVRQVLATREPVALADATAAGPFRADPYVVRARPRSVLCLPLVARERLLGALYLENNLVAAAFPAALSAALSILAAQAAAALENARAREVLTRRGRAQEEEIERSNADLSSALRRVKDAQKRLLVQEKLATLGGLTAGIAHEIKNPLNFINNFAESSVGIADELRDELSAQRTRLDPDALANLEELLGELRSNAAKINEHGRRADDIVRSMLEHSRGGSAEWRSVDVNALLKEYVNLAYQGFRSQDPSFNTTIEQSYAPGLAPVSLVPQDLGRVFLNLVNNACYAVHAKKKALGRAFSPVLRVSTRDLGDAVELRLRDNGTGIAPEVLARIYDPFFTTKPTGDGTGLGLSISHDIVRAQGGTMEVDTKEGEFTEFVITLPRVPPTSPPTPSP